MFFLVNNNISEHKKHCHVIYKYVFSLQILSRCDNHIEENLATIILAYVQLLSSCSLQKYSFSVGTTPANDRMHGHYQEAICSCWLSDDFWSDCVA